MKKLKKRKAPAVAGASYLARNTREGREE